MTVIPNLHRPTQLDETFSSQETINSLGNPEGEKERKGILKEKKEGLR